jgi:hypothetical protein
MKGLRITAGGLFRTAMRSGIASDEAWTCKQPFQATIQGQRESWSSGSAGTFEMSVRVRAICNWTDSASLNRRIMEQSLWTESDGIEFVDDDCYDWLVIFNAKKKVKPRVPKQRVIGFIQEPPDHTFYDRKIGTYCSVVYTCADPSTYSIRGKLIGFPCGMFYHMPGPLTDYLQDSLIDQKRKELSMVTSSNAYGFNLNRVQLARELVRQESGDVFGRGLDVGHGELANKADGLLPYHYSVCMENGLWKGYISDKIIDAILCRTIPLYVGAPDVLDYIPFALPLKHYQEPAKAKDEIDGIIASTSPQKVVEQMNAWARKYANEYTVYSKIKHIVLNQPVQPQRRARLFAIAKAGLRKVLARS